MATELDPFDVEALERSLNESAVRVSAIWVSFLVFGLYLIIAVGSVTQPQLFRNDPINLPVLNVDLPVWGFFFVAPVLFVIFHCYLLVQVLLLRRTAAAYNEVVENGLLSTTDRARIRQRLTNTLFTQIFAGSPNEREGLLGDLLRFMARVTLAIGPVLVLLMFQGWFLRYQDGWVTLTHRILIFVDLAAVFWLWNAILKPQGDIGWPGIRPLVWFIAVVLFSWLILHFPREPLTNWARFYDETGCGKWPVPNRFHLPEVDVVDDAKLATIENLAQARGLTSYQGERTYDLSNRNLRCGDFRRADLRRVNLRDTDLRGANLADAELQGAVLGGVKLQRANLEGVQMQGAWLVWQELTYIPGKGPTIEQRETSLAGATLLWAQLQGAQLARVDLTGADLGGAELQGANLSRARLDVADLRWAQLQGANLQRASLQAADLRYAQLQGANLDKAHMEGARLDKAALTHAYIHHAYVWRAVGAICDDAQVTEPQLDLMRGLPDRERNATKDEETQSIDEWGQQLARETAWSRKLSEPTESKWHIAGQEHDNEIKDVWRGCETKARTQDNYKREHAEYLIRFVCDSTVSQGQLAYGVYRNWIGEPDIESIWFRVDWSDRRAVARGLLEGLDAKGCPGARKLTDRVKERLQHFAR
jgi:uncharacterized protein YjbI with pentapeptide repeats